MFAIGFLTLDILIILALFIGCFFIVMSKGAKTLARIILAFYPTTLIYLHLPYITVSDAIARVAVYIVLYIVIHMLIKKNFTAKQGYSNGKRALDAVLLSLAAVIIFLTMYYHVIPLASLYNFTLPFSAIFTTTLPFGVWLILPVVAVTIANRGHN